MKKVFTVVLFLLILIVTSTVFAGTPQVIIKDAKKSDILAVLIPDMTSNGMNIKSMNEYSIVFSQFKNNFWGSVFTGSNSFEINLIYNIVEMRDDVLITATSHLITFPGTAKEETTPADENINNKVQFYLNRLRTGFNGGYFYGFDYEAKKDYWKVIKVATGGSFDKAGIKAGDKIIALNDNPIKKMTPIDLNAAFAGGEGATCSFTIESNSQTKVYKLTKYYVAPIYSKSIKSKT